MPIKTYVSDKKNLAVAWERPSAISGKAVQANIVFVDGAFSTDDESAQKFIEGLPTFKEGSISLRTAKDELAEAEAKAKSLRAAADAAEAAAKEAEAAVKSLSAPKAPAKA